MKVIIVGSKDDYEKACNHMRSHPNFQDVELVHENTNVICDIETFKDVAMNTIKSKERGILLVGSSFSMTNDGNGILHTIKHLNEDVTIMSNVDLIERFDDTIRSLSKPTTNMLSIPVVEYSDFDSGKERRRKRRKSNRKH